MTSIFNFGSAGDPNLLNLAVSGVMAAGGGGIDIPAGSYFFNPVTIDYSAIPGRFAKRLHIEGEGSGSTCLSFAGNGVSYVGNASWPESQFDMSGLRLVGGAVGTGLDVSIAAFLSTDDLLVEGFDTNLQANDLEQSLFKNSNFRWGRCGVDIQTAAYTTDPNSLIFENCAISNNSQSGMRVVHPNAFKMIGGSVQYNGKIGGPDTEFGIKMIDAGTGYGTVSFDAVAFEGNGGAGDFWSEQNANLAAFDFSSCGFVRTDLSTVGYGENHVRLSGSALALYSFKGNGFMYGNGYVPNAARPYFRIDNPNAKLADDGFGFFMAPSERPAWAGRAVQDMPLSVNARGGFGALYTRVAANKNFYVDQGWSFGDGISIGGINDAGSALIPLNIRASKINVGALPTSASGLPSGTLYSSSGTVKVAP